MPPEGVLPTEAAAGDDASGAKRPLDEQGDGNPAKRQAFSGKDCSFRVLVKSSRVGSIIGRAGSVIKQLSEETGARIRILDAVPGAEERVVQITSEEGQPHDEEWPAQKAVMAVMARMHLPDDQAEPVPAPATPQQHTTRLMICNSQTGCLIGKGGDIVRNIRNASGASVRVLPQEDIPPFAAPGMDRVVSVTAEYGPSVAAVRMVLKQLRENPPKDGFVPSAAPRASPMGMRGGMGGGYGMQQQMGMPPQMMGGYGMQPGYGMPPQQHMGAPPGGAGGQQTKMLLPVPTSFVGTIIGKGGSNISQIRAMSGARVRVHDPLPGEGTRNVEIIGNPEQVSQAQQLVAAYVLSASQTQAAGGAPGQVPGMGQMPQGMPQQQQYAMPGMDPQMAAQQAAYAQAYAAMPQAYNPQMYNPYQQQ